MSKETVIHDIMNAVLRAEITKGHLKWKASDIARGAKVSRPLVYYHFGKTKKEILKNCIEFVALEYFGLDEAGRGTLKAGELLPSLLKTRKMYINNPALVEFYQRWRMRPSPIREMLLEIERRYQAKIVDAFPFLSQEQVIATHAILHGLITAPFITPGAMAEACEVTLSWIHKLKKNRKSQSC